MNNGKILAEEIVAVSVSDNWKDAKKEWMLSGIYIADEPQTCLCSHFPIIEVCVLTNKHTGMDVEVGNCCVKKFMGFPSGKILDGLKRIKEDIGKALTEDAAEFAHDRRWINDWEYDFYMDTRRKRKMTDKQIGKRESINRKVLHAFNEYRRDVAGSRV